MIVAVIVGIVVGLGVHMMLFNVCFPAKGDFKEALYYYFKPDCLSMMDGEYSKDVSKSFVLFVWLIAGVLAGVSAGAVVGVIAMQVMY